MSKCWRVSSWALSEYADGLLPEPKKGWVEKHLSTCAGCSVEVKSLQTVKGQLHALPSASLSEDFDLKMKSALLVAQREKAAARREAAPIAPKRHIIFVGLPRPVQVFAVALLSITAALGIYNMFAPTRAVYLASVSGAVEIRHSQEKGWSKVTGRVELQSGDEVRTAAGAQADIFAGRVYQAKLMEESEWIPLELATSGKEKNAHFVLKRGALLVKTGPAFRGRAMRVEGPSGKAEVVGTTFMMRAVSGGETGLSVIDGTVDFRGKRVADPTKVDVKRLETAEVKPKGTAELPRPIKAKDWRALAEWDPGIRKNATVVKLMAAIDHPEKVNAQEIKEWQKNLMAEADNELGSYGFYLLGQVEEEKMAPAEAMQQYVGVLAHFPQALESAWAAEFLRTKLDLVPSDLDLMGEEIAVRDFESALQEIPTARGLTPEFLKGLEPQRRFVVAQMEVKEKEGRSACLVERAITFERNLGEKNYRPVGFLDSVKRLDNGEVLLRIGKLFTRDDSGRVRDVSTAVFHPDGRLLYTVDRQIRYQGESPVGYVEFYKDPSGEALASVERKVELRSTKGLLLRYSETVKNKRSELLLNRKRSDLVYDKKGNVVDYQDELVDVDRRVALERGREQFKVAVSEERLLTVAETPYSTMDEMLQKMRELRKRSTPLKLDRELDRESSPL